MAEVQVRIDSGKLNRAIQESEGLPAVLGEAVSSTAAKANAYGAGFRTGIWHDHATGETRGDTAPFYSGDVQRHGRTQVGIVHTSNYAAMKDNHLHNTLLKSI